METNTANENIAALCLEIKTLAQNKRIKLRIYDAPQYADRYTIVYDDGSSSIVYVAANHAPFHPLGIGMHGELARRDLGKHLGKSIRPENLPHDTLLVVRQDLT